MKNTIRNTMLGLLFIMGAGQVWSCDNLTGPDRSGSTFFYTFKQSKTQTLQMNPQSITFTKIQHNTNEIMSDWFVSGMDTNNAYCFTRFTNTRNYQFNISFDLQLNPALVTAAGMSRDGHRIFRVNNSPYLGIMFDMGISENGSIPNWTPITNANLTQNLPAFNWVFNQEKRVIPMMRSRFIMLDTPPSRINMAINNQQLARVGLASPLVATGQMRPRFYQVRDQGSFILNLNSSPVTISEKVKSCEVSGGRDQNVALREIYKRDIPSTGSETLGGNFTLSINCNLPNNVENNQFKAPKVYVTLTGLNNTANNGSNNLLTIESGTGKAAGVSLRLKRAENNEVVQFGPDSSQMHNTGQFQLADASGGNSTNGFNIYYVNNGNGPNGKVKGGEVKAAVTYTLSYQ